MSSRGMDRYTAIPVTIWADREWTELDRDAQWLRTLLWTWPTRNYGGFMPLLPAVWITVVADTTEEDIRRTLKALETAGVAYADWDTAEVWLRPFIRSDAIYSPNIYVAALRAIEECLSPKLRRLAWAEVLDIHPPPLIKSDDPVVRERMTQRIESAFESLRSKMASESGGFT